MTAAADKLFLTQPAVSQQIRSLEEELGVALLVRGVRQVKPTIQGQLLFDYAKRILNLTQQAEVAIQTMSKEISGSLRIGTVNSIGMYLISPIVGLFLKYNSNLNIRLIYGSARQVIDAMKENEVDLTILPDLKMESGVEFADFESQFLMKDEILLVGSGKDTTIPKSITLKDFVTRPVVMYSEMYPGFLRAFEDKIIENKVEFMPVFEADNVGTLKRVIESGLGWGFLPAHSIRKQVRMRRMTHVHVSDLEYSVSINMYTRKTEKIRQMSDVFYRAIHQQTLQH